MKVRTFRYMAPETGDSPGGGAPDRGDDYTPPADEVEIKDPEAVEPKSAPEGTARELPGALAESEGESPEPKKGGAIPLDRHKEILQKERERREALERELENTRRGQQLARSNEDLARVEETIAGMEKEYLDLLAKGDVPGAAAKMAEIRRTERQISETLAEQKAKVAEASAYARVKYETTVERLEAAYPVINPDHEDYDEAKTKEVVELRDAYMATGKYSAPEAIQKAVKQLLKAETKKQEAATSTDVRVTEKDVAEKLREERKAEAVKKAVETSTKQPPPTTGVGADSDKAGGKLKGADVIKMKQDEFAKLSEKDLAELRGDAL